MSKKQRILIYGYGNPGRQDDGLGILMVERMEKWIQDQNLTNIFTDSNYQLNIEDAAEIAEYDIVIFADASKEEIADFVYDEVEPSIKVDFSMHSVSPSFVLGLSEQINEKSPRVYLLHIKGYEWEFMEEITPEAESNLEKADNFLKNKIMEYMK